MAFSDASASKETKDTGKAVAHSQMVGVPAIVPLLVSKGFESELEESQMSNWAVLASTLPEF